MAETQKTRIGRPRTFDEDEAIEAAMLVFWERGYEGASLEELTRAMGVARVSMYRTFGDKRELFRQVLDRYTEHQAVYVMAALQQPTARGVAETFLDGSVRSSTVPGRPAGCLAVHGALATGDAARPVRDTLAAWRETGVTHLQQRFERAVDEKDLPPDIDARTLARYLMTVANGIAVQAAGGASRDELRAVESLALRSWPS